MLGPKGPFDVVEMLGGLRPGWFVDAGTRAPRGFAPGYDPAALQAAPGTCIRPDGALRCWGLRPVGLLRRAPSGTRPDSPASADAPV